MSQQPGRGYHQPNKWVRIVAQLVAGEFCEMTHCEISDLGVAAEAHFIAVASDVFKAVGGFEVCQQTSTF